MDLRGIYLVPTGQRSRRAETGAPPGLQLNDAASTIKALVGQTQVGTPTEYRQIPKIWETALAAGRRNNPGEILRVLAIALPETNEPMHDWQAVVLGGGIVNGFSQAGIAPRERIRVLLEDKTALPDGWNRAMQLAGPMADDESVRLGTRYDAMRILGADTFERSGANLTKYLRGDVHDELVMGAISGLSDMESPAARDAITAAFPVYSKSNQALAITLLLRDETRIAMLVNAIEKGTIPATALSTEQWVELKKIKSEDLRMRIAALQPPHSNQESGSKSTN